jgi:hypothetical protein
MKSKMYSAGIVLVCSLSSFSALRASDSSEQMGNVNIFTDPTLGKRTIVQTVQSGRIYAFVSAYSSKCLDIKDHSLANGGPLIQWDCTTLTNQKFRAIGTAAAGFTLATIESKLCLQVQNEANENGNPFRQDLSCDPTKRVFKFVKSSGQTMKIVRSVDGVDKCLDISGPSTENNTPIHLWDCHGGPSQDFLVFEQAPK